VPLALSLSEGQTWTLCSDTAAAEAQLWGVDCDGALSGSLYNGNDALVVECDSAVVDSFGQVGFDPGKGWQSKRDPEVSTMDVRLLRCDESTDTEPSDEFELDSGWAVWPLGEEKQAALMRCLEMQSPGQGGAGSDF
jgi:hypothetical protein